MLNLNSMFYMNLINLTQKYMTYSILYERWYLIEKSKKKKNQLIISL
jgi:hypothetical protein